MCKYRTVLSFSAISSFVSSSLIHTFPTQMSNAMKISNKSQVIAWEGSWKKTKGWFAWASSACSSLQKSSRVLLGSLSQSITCQIESLFTFWSVHPLLLNSTQSVSLLVFSLSLSNSFYYLDFIEWASQLKETLSPHMQLRLFIKEGPQCQRCSADWVGGGKKSTCNSIWSYSCKTKPFLCLSQECHFQATFTALLAFDSVNWRYLVPLKTDCPSS